MKSSILVLGLVLSGWSVGAGATQEKQAPPAKPKVYLESVSDGGTSATYSYLANSALIEQVVFNQDTTTRMTTSKSYDKLNRLMSIASLDASGTSLSSFAYVYNAANQRTRANVADGSHRLGAYWLYEYDNLGQVKSGKKYWSDGTRVAGQQFEYGFDDIGNRTTTKAGGDQNGANLRTALYYANTLNQYWSNTVPGVVDVMGVASATSSVTVNALSTYRKSEYFRTELPRPTLAPSPNLLPFGRRLRHCLVLTQGILLWDTSARATRAQTLL